MIQKKLLKLTRFNPDNFIFVLLIQGPWLLRKFFKVSTKKFLEWKKWAKYYENCTFHKTGKYHDTI